MTFNKVNVIVAYTAEKRIRGVGYKEGIKSYDLILTS